MKALYRVVAALAALLSVPALYFMKLVRIVIELGFMEGYFDDSFSISDFVQLSRDYGIEGGDFAMTEAMAQTLAPLKSPAIITLVFLCLSLVMVLAVFFCSAFTNAKKLNLVFSAVGAVAVIGTIASFNSMTDIVTSGTVPLSDIVNTMLGDSANLIAGIAAMLGAGSLISIIGDLIILQLGSAFTAVLFIFIFEIVWALSFILINMDEHGTPKQKKQKKAKQTNNS